MLETVRQYALDRLRERSELDELRRRHAERYAELTEAAEPELVRGAQAVWLERLDEEYDNVRAALAWSLEAGEVELGMRIASALVRFWSTRGLMSEGRRWLAEAFAQGSGVSDAVLARARFAAGYAALGQGDYGEAAVHFEQSLELARRGENAGAEAAALAQLGWLAMTQAHDGRARELATRSLELARDLGDQVTASGALNVLAELAAGRGGQEEAARTLEESLALRRELGDKRLVADSLLNLGGAHIACGRAEQAAGLLQESLALARELRDSWSISRALAELGRVDLQAGRPQAAGALFTEGIALAKERGDKRVMAECLQGLAIAAACRGEERRAVRVLGASESLRDSISATPTRPERLVYERFVPPLRERMGAVAFEAELAAGRVLATDAALELAGMGVSLPGDSLVGH
jgi:tetratricopeptide (TPR) repeat protein